MSLVPRLSAAALVAVLGLALTSCGGEDEKSASSKPSEGSSQAGTNSEGASEGASAAPSTGGDAPTSAAAGGTNADTKALCKASYTTLESKEFVTAVQAKDYAKVAALYREVGAAMSKVAAPKDMSADEREGLALTARSASQVSTEALQKLLTQPEPDLSLLGLDEEEAKKAGAFTLYQTRTCMGAPAATAP